MYYASQCTYMEVSVTVYVTSEQRAAVWLVTLVFIEGCFSAWEGVVRWLIAA